MICQNIKQEFNTDPNPLPFNTSIEIAKHNQAAKKFWDAYVNLQIYQQKHQNDSSVKYPFAIQQNFNEILVHLGDNRVEISNKDYLNQISFLPMPGGFHFPQEDPKPKYRPCSVIDQKDSKNIVKNYCKAIITYACKNKELCLFLLGSNAKATRFIDFLQSKKKMNMNIKLFSSLLVDCHENREFSRIFRILSRYFMQKEAVCYVFNSKIQQHTWHLKYRKQVLKGIKDPSRFLKIKNL